MKVVIDIPDKAWDIAKEYGHLDICGIELSERVMNGTPYEERPKYFPPCEDCNKKMEEIRQAYDKMKAGARPQGEYVDISKLRLMTVEECAGHTIDYAMGWKACIEWIKKGGAE